MANLTPEQLDLIRGLSMAPGSSSAAFDGLNYQPVYAAESGGQEGGGNPAMMRQAGNLEQIIGYDPSKTEKGKDLYDIYKPSGEFDGKGMFKDDDAGQMFAMFLLTALTMGMGLPALGAGGAGGGAGVAGAVAGDAFLPGALASTGGLSAPFGSILPGLEAFAVPGAVGGAAGAESLGALGSLGGAEGVAPSLLGEAGGGLGSLGGGGLNTSLLGEAGGFGGLGQAAPGISGIGSEAAGFGGTVNQGASFGGMGGQMFGGLGPELAGAAIGAGAPESSGLLGTIKDAANNLLPKDFGFNAKTIASALPLIGTLAGKPEQQQGTGQQPLSPSMQEFMNRPGVQWDWDRIQNDAKSQGMGVGAYLSRNWPRVTGGEYNKPVQMAQGGALQYIQGAGSGRSDSIPAELSDGEYVLDAETVAMLGDGSSRAGAKQLDRMRHQLRQHKGAALSRGQISPDARHPLAYLQGAK